MAHAYIPLRVKGPVYDYDHTVLKEGVTYQSYDNEPYLPQFKKCTLKAKGYDDTQTSAFVTKDCKYGKTYVSKPVVAYSVYDLGVVNLPYTSEVYGYVYGEESEIEVVTTISEGYTYQEKTTNTLSGSFGMSITAKAVIDVLTVGKSVSKGIQGTIANEKSISTTCTQTGSVIVKDKITTGPGYYFKQYRANYHAYLVEEYSFDWNSTLLGYERHMWHSDSEYTLYSSLYTLTNVKVEYEFISDAGFHFVKYNPNENGTFEYAGPVIGTNTLYI